MQPYASSLRIDPEFQRLISPLSPDEYAQLEENLIRDGCREPIFTWNHVILDGHNRIEICTRRTIPYTIVSLDFSCREAAIAWICSNQIGQRSITEETRRYLIGKRYEAEKMIGSTNPKEQDQHSHEVTRQVDTESPIKGLGQIAISLGNEYKLAHGTIMRYGRYSKALDRIATCDDDLAAKLLSGQVKVPQKVIYQIAQMPERELHRTCSRIAVSGQDSLAYYQSRKLLAGQINHRKTAKGSIKDMPAFDPDAEISSLTLTMPSWRSSIERVRIQTNMSATSYRARRRLNYELLQLNYAIKRMQKSIKEEP